MKKITINISFISGLLLFIIGLTHAGAFSVMTYNINWGKGEFPVTDPQKTMHLIVKTNPDIVLLQEVTPQWKKWINKTLKSKYPYRMIYFHQREGGSAVLSKTKILGSRKLQNPYGWFPASVSRIKTNMGNLQVVNIHLTPPLVAHNSAGLFARGVLITKSKRLKEMRFILKKIKRGIPTIIAGDFNEAENNNATKYLERMGFRNVIRSIPKNQYTWYWQWGLLPLKGRYDHIFYSRPFRLKRARILRGGNSDHFPVVAAFTR